MSDSIQRIKEAAARVSATTEKGSLAWISSAPLPCDLRREREEKEKIERNEAWLLKLREARKSNQPDPTRIVTYGPTNTNLSWTEGRGRAGNPTGHGYYPSFAVTEVIGIANHDPMIYRHGD
jgi:hypothetical protein